MVSESPLMVSLTFSEFILLSFLIIITCILCVILLNKFSFATSRIGMYHNEGAYERFKKLYSTYTTLLFLLTVFIMISSLSFFKIDKDYNIFVIGLSAASVYLLSIRIIVTTGLINVTKLERENGFKRKQAIERVLSTLYSLSASIIILLFFGMFIIVLDLNTNTTEKIGQLYSTNFYVNFSFLTLFICSITFPAIIASVGEGLRYIVSKKYPIKKDERIIVIDENTIIKDTNIIIKYDET